MGRSIGQLYSVPLLILAAITLQLTGCNQDTAVVQPPASQRAATPVLVTRDYQPSVTTDRGQFSRDPFAGPDWSDDGLASLVRHGDRSSPYVALTFDACQSPRTSTGYDESIIRILISTGTPATLFLSGLWMQQHPTQTRILAANPLFELANHSWSHPDFTGLSLQEIDTEIRRTQELMATLTGRQASLFRFPFDVTNDEALAAVEQHGLRAISGDVVSGDPDPNVSAQDIVQTIKSQTGNGSVVIMHMNTLGWHTAEALPVVINQLRDRGYTFVTVSQLLELARPVSEGRQEEETTHSFR